MTEHIQNGMAIIQLPGNQASRDEFCSNCYFNNVSIGAEHVLKTYALSVQRILILDWDIHHGYGTQKFWYNNPQVLYISIHHYDNGCFCSRPDANYDNIGSDDGVGFNINVPLTVSGRKNGDYLFIWQKLLLPVAFEVGTLNIVCIYIFRQYYIMMIMLPY